MNKSDSERVAAVLEKMGYKPAESEKQADLIVINACSVRQTAVDRVYGKARHFIGWKKRKPVVTILTGCVAEEDKKKLADKFDVIIDIDEWNKFPICNFQFINKSKIQNPKSKIQNPRFKIQGTNYFHIQPRYTEKFRAFVPIMTGCKNFCSYCVVPYVRGGEVSRNVVNVLDEVRGLAEKGCLEITLLGQNVNAYKPKGNLLKKDSPYKHPFAALLWGINQIPGIERIYFTAAHPKDMSDEVIDALTLPKMVNYLHLPVQSGDDGVLRVMNRRYAATDYAKLIKKIRAKKPDIALGTDIIVGFPGETKKQFENTVKLYKKADFDIAYLAMYSPREGTAAAKMKDNVSRAEKKRRWNALQNLMEKITLEKNKKYVGKNVSVLVDECKGGYCTGNSREMKRVRFLGKKSMVGRILDIKVEKAFEWILEGDIFSS